MEWDTFLAGYASEDRQRAERLAEEYGREAAKRHVRYNLTPSVNDLEMSLRQDLGRVRTRIDGLYESIDVSQCPDGWSITNDRQTQSDGTLVVRTDVTGPNGGRGFFVRGFNAVQRRIELLKAFLQMDGATARLPAMITGRAIELVPGKGTPTHLYFTLYQFKVLGVPAGWVRWWRSCLHRLRLRQGAFAKSGVVASMRMRTIWNLETILHLHWLRQTYPDVSLSQLIAHTASVRYAEDYAIQCGYKVVNVSYVPGDEHEVEIDKIMKEFEDDNAQRREEHAGMLARYAFDRQTVMKQNFDIDLCVVPA